MFGPATEQVLDLAKIRAGSRVLDIGTGSGEQTLAAARRAGSTGYVLATDISASIWSDRWVPSTSLFLASHLC
jgi:ubiquinone/menaquinone biosynthesis C-methylase UbiE